MIKYIKRLVKRISRISSIKRRICIRLKMNSNKYGREKF